MFDRSPAAIGAYALAAALAVLEIAILWQALHPDVSDDYRAYYIDRTTTCLPQPVTGAYKLGTELDFRSGGDGTREIRPCGWDGPAGDGLHSIGRRSRLRLAVDRPGPFSLMLELTGVTLPGTLRQRVIVFADEEKLQEIEIMPGETERYTITIPAEVLDGDGYLDILLDYPDAINPGRRIADTYWRSVKLTSASLDPA